MYTDTLEDWEQVVTNDQLHERAANPYIDDDAYVHQPREGGEGEGEAEPQMMESMDAMVELNDQMECATAEQTSKKKQTPNAKELRILQALIFAFIVYRITCEDGWECYQVLKKEQPSMYNWIIANLVIQVFDIITDNFDCGIPFNFNISNMYGRCGCCQVIFGLFFGRKMKNEVMEAFFAKHPELEDMQFTVRFMAELRLLPWYFLLFVLVLVICVMIGYGIVSLFKKCFGSSNQGQQNNDVMEGMADMEQMEGMADMEQMEGMAEGMEEMEGGNQEEQSNFALQAINTIVQSFVPRTV